jgi:hypothetical protein
VGGYSHGRLPQGPIPRRLNERTTMPRRKSLRSQLYRAARDLGNVEAVEKGPSALGKRYVRRTAYRKTNSGLRGILRALGLDGTRRG